MNTETANQLFYIFTMTIGAVIALFTTPPTISRIIESTKLMVIEKTVLGLGVGAFILGTLISFTNQMATPAVTGNYSQFVLTWWEFPVIYLIWPMAGLNIVLISRKWQALHQPADK